jgi:ABC-type branched-subunit amino acid transport system permease subunit
MGVGSLASAAAGGIFIIWGNEFLRHTPLGTQYFPLFTGGLLIVQLVFRPQGAITSLEHDLSRAMHLVRRGRSAEVEPIEVM